MDCSIWQQYSCNSTWQPGLCEPSKSRRSRMTMSWRHSVHRCSTPSKRRAHHGAVENPPFDNARGRSGRSLVRVYEDLVPTAGPRDRVPRPNLGRRHVRIRAGARASRRVTCRRCDLCGRRGMWMAVVPKDIPCVYEWVRKREREHFNRYAFSSSPTPVRHVVSPSHIGKTTRVQREPALLPRCKTTPPKNSVEKSLPNKCNDRR